MADGLRRWWYAVYLGARHIHLVRGCDSAQFSTITDHARVGSIHNCGGDGLLRGCGRLVLLALAIPSGQLRMHGGETLAELTLPTRETALDTENALELWRD